jgi:hypothetical protein
VRILFLPHPCQHPLLSVFLMSVNMTGV